MAIMRRGALCTFMKYSPTEFSKESRAPAISREQRKTADHAREPGHSFLRLGGNFTF
jgi:hypothetical protein